MGYLRGNGLNCSSESIPATVPVPGPSYAGVRFYFHIFFLMNKSTLRCGPQAPSHIRCSSVNLQVSSCWWSNFAALAKFDHQSAPRETSALRPQDDCEGVDLMHDRVEG